MDILALAHEIILVPGLRFVDTFARGSCYSFFSAPLSRRCIRIPFSFRNPISGRCPVFPWISAAPNLLISRLLLSHSFLFPCLANPRYRSFQPNTANLFSTPFVSTKPQPKEEKRIEVKTKRPQQLVL